jgi:hypothetical protein
MNTEIVVGFCNDHKTHCPYRAVSTCIRTGTTCTLCHSMNRDISLLITRLKGARESLDVGLALSPAADTVPYEPYKHAGFRVFFQKGVSESERIKSIFDEAVYLGYDSVVLLAHCAPNLPLHYLESALSELRNGVGLVLGPSENAMFYLIGIKKMLYERICSDGVFGSLSFENLSMRDATVKTMKDYYNNCSLLPTWYTLRSIEDLKKFLRDSSRGLGWSARWTYQFAQSILG